MKKHVLIVARPQFGTLVDTYQYCRHLGGTFTFTYVCWDYGHDTPSVEGTKVILVSRAGGKIRRLSRLIRRACQEMSLPQYDLCVVVYFAGCSVLGFLRKSVPTVLDIRTGYVWGGIRTWFRNKLLAIEAHFYPHISVITPGLRDRLKLPKTKCTVIPLGADPVVQTQKDFSSLRLLYVGTLEQRRIHETVDGFTRFCQSAEGESSATYEIVGFGPSADVEALNAAIASSPFRNRVRYVGRIPHAQLVPFLTRNNVGIAYIPVTPEYEDQPPTKIFEYLLAGMAVVATSTSANRQLITDINGVLCGDTPEEFCKALQRLSNRRHGYDSTRILQGTERFTWAQIIKDHVLPLWISIARGLPSASVPQGGDPGSAADR